jgi:hypothetical protein
VVTPEGSDPSVDVAALGAVLNSAPAGDPQRSSTDCASNR